MKKLIILILSLLLILVVAGISVLAVLNFTHIPVKEIIRDFISHYENTDTDLDEDDDQTDPISSYEYHDIIVKYAEEYKVPVTLIYAVIECESSFRETTKSSAGACGLMQLMPVTYNDVREWLGLDYTDDQIMDPEVNIQCGTYYLSRMYKMFDDWELAVAAYNAGPGNVQKWLKNDDYTDDGKLVYIPFKETSNHVKKVTKAWEKYESEMKG